MTSEESFIRRSKKAASQNQEQATEATLLLLRSAAAAAAARPPVVKNRAVMTSSSSSCSYPCDAWVDQIQKYFGSRNPNRSSLTQTRNCLSGILCNVVVGFKSRGAARPIVASFIPTAPNEPTLTDHPPPTIYFVVIFDTNTEQVYANLGQDNMGTSALKCASESAA